MYISITFHQILSVFFMQDGISELLLHMWPHSQLSMPVKREETECLHCNLSASVHFSVLCALCWVSFEEHISTAFYALLLLSMEGKKSAASQ